VCVCMFMLYNTYKAQEGLKKTDESVGERVGVESIADVFLPPPTTIFPSNSPIYSPLLPLTSFALMEKQREEH